MKERHREMQKPPSWAERVAPPPTTTTVTPTNPEIIKRFATFGYKYKDEPEKFAKRALSNFSSQETQNIKDDVALSLIEFKELDKAKKFHKALFHIKDKRFLRTHFLDVERDPPAVLVDNVSPFQRLDQFYRVNHRHKNSQPSNAIMYNPFIHMLRGIADGLFYLFQKNLYHGNLLDGVFYNDKEVVLYNLHNSDNSFAEGAKTDMESLFTICQTFMEHNKVAFDKLELLEFHDFFAKIHPDALMDYDATQFCWILKHPVLWNGSERFQYMNKICDMVYNQKLLHNCQVDQYFEYEWQNAKMSNLSDVYTFGIQNSANAYKYPMDIIYFWRNIIHHYNDHNQIRDTSKSYEEIEAIINKEMGIVLICYQAIDKYLSPQPGNYVFLKLREREIFRKSLQVLYETFK